MLLQSVPTLLSSPPPPVPSQNNAKGNHFLCVSPYIQYFITILLPMETFKPSLLIESSTFKSFVLSPWLLLELSASIPYKMKH
jgi:hypothetical protein